MAMGQGLIDIIGRAEELLRYPLKAKQTLLYEYYKTISLP